MKKTLPVWTLVCVSLALVPGIYAAQEPEKKEERKLEESQSVTTHSITIDGRKIEYTATAGTYVLENDEGEQMASMFYVAYTLAGVDDPAERPVTFSFNGGPGAAAVWVQMGAFGPKKVLADDEGFPLPPPGELVDNPYSILDVTDLVFIDPVGTGFSRPAPGQKGDQFWSFEGDVRSVGAFIRLWLTRNERWSSPKLLAGESYGTTRAAGLASDLQQRYGMYLNGVVLVAPRLNWLHQQFAVGNDMPYVVYLPTYAATAWYHRKVPPELAGSLPALLDEVETFALGDYATALLQGERLEPGRRRAIVEKLARYTGLSAEYVERTNLRIEIFRFVKELLRAEGKTVGRLDSRFTGIGDYDAAGEFADYDPSLESILIGYVTLINDYLRRTLGYESDLVYEALNYQVNGQWSLGEDQFLNVAEPLRGAITRNHDLHVLFVCGYYDLATPYFDCKQTISHLGLPEELRGNVGAAYFESGHMTYIRKMDHARLREDLLAFIREATGR